MRDLIFSHISDIDGMGSVVLLKLVNKDMHYELCETFNVNDKFEEYYNSKDIYNYDRIYITDLCLDDEHLKIIQNDKLLKDKVKIFDHHESVLQFNTYDFVNITIKDEKGYCCGTTLFYNYLLDNKIIESNSAIDKFCELTRRHDTWEWKKIYNDEMSRDLSLFFETVGTEKYIEVIEKVLYAKKGLTYGNGQNTLLRIGTFLNGSNICGINMQELNGRRKIIYGSILNNGVTSEILSRGYLDSYSGIVTNAGNNRYSMIRNSGLEKRIMENTMDREL